MSVVLVLLSRLQLEVQAGATRDGSAFLFVCLSVCLSLCLFVCRLKCYVAGAGLSCRFIDPCYCYFVNLFTVEFDAVLLTICMSVSLTLTHDCHFAIVMCV